MCSQFRIKPYNITIESLCDGSRQINILTMSLIRRASASHKNRNTTSIFDKPRSTRVFERFFFGPQRSSTFRIIWNPLARSPLRDAHIYTYIHRSPLAERAPRRFRKWKLMCAFHRARRRIYACRTHSHDVPARKIVSPRTHTIYYVLFATSATFFVVVVVLQQACKVGAYANRVVLAHA